MPSNSDIEAFLGHLLSFGPFDEVVDFLVEHPCWLEEDNLRAAWELARTRSELAPVSGRLAFVRRTIERLSLAETVNCFDDLVRHLEEESLLLTREFKDLATRLDERQPGRFAGFLAARLEVDRRLRAASEFVEAVQRGAKRSDLADIVLDESTLCCLAAMAKSHGEVGATEVAGQYACMTEALERVTYNRQRLTQAAASGSPRVMQRALTWGETDLWPVRSGISPDQVERLLGSMRRGETSFDSALRQVAAHAARQLNEAGQQSSPPNELLQPALPSREFWLTTAQAAFCVLSTAEIGTLDQARRAARAFRSLLGGPWWSRLEPAEAACTMLRYAKFVLLQRAAIPGLENELRSLLRRVEEMVPRIATGAHPGLERDLRLAQARILGELVGWDRSCALRASQEFQAGLGVRWARYDCEAKGLGLSDYAGALRSLPIAHPLRREIEGVYGEALWNLMPSRFPRGRVSVLVNYASFLNEQSGRVRAQNQERALRLLNEALLLCEKNAPDKAALSAPFFREQLATVWLVHGNVLRARRFCATSAGVTKVEQVALSYFNGLSALGPDGHHQLQGLLRLNLGYAYLEDDSAESVSTASIHLREAVELLDGAPALQARAQEADTEAWMRSARDPVDHEQLGQRIRLLGACGERCRRHGDSEGVGLAALRSAELRMLLGAAKPAQFQAAQRSLGQAHEAFLEAGVPDMAVHALRLQASVFLYWHKTIGKPTKKEELCRKAEASLSLALDLARRDAGATISFLDMMSREATCSAVASDLIWVRTQLGAGFHEIEELAVRAAAVEVHRTSKQSTAECVDRRKSILAEHALWSRTFGMKIEHHVADEVDELENAVEEREREQALRTLEGSSKADQSLEGSRRLLGEKEVEVQFVISAWGGVAVIRDGRAAGRAVLRPFPVSRSVLERWLFGSLEDGARLGWVTVNERRSKSPDDQARWEREYGALLDDLSHSVWEPVLRDAGIDLAGKGVWVVPGPLATLPLQAARFAGVPLIEQVTGWACLPVPHAPPKSAGSRPGRALLTLSNPSLATSPSLDGTASEIAELARICIERGLEVEVLASSGAFSGREALRHHGVELPEGTHVSTGRPTPERVAERLADTDLFIYSGHGLGSTALGGQLLLVDDRGEPSPLCVLRLLAAKPFQRPTSIVLSACETAWEARGMMDGMTSVTSSFLRLGATSVLGSLWWIRDVRASVATRAYLTELLGGTPPDRAYVAAMRTLAATGATGSEWGAYCLWLGQ